MTILALDLGTTTGWALHDGRDVAESGAWRLPKADPAAAYLELGDKLLHLYKRRSVNLIAYESVPAQAHAGGDAAHRWGGFEAIVLFGCARFQVQYLRVGIATWKRAAGLRAGTGPAEAIAAAQRRWPGVEFAAEDEAVARWVAVAAASRTGRRK